MARLQRLGYATLKEAFKGCELRMIVYGVHNLLVKYVASILTLLMHMSTIVVICISLSSHDLSHCKISHRLCDEIRT